MQFMMQLIYNYWLSRTLTMIVYLLGIVKEVIELA